MPGNVALHTTRQQNRLSGRLKFPRSHFQETWPNLTLNLQAVVKIPSNDPLETFANRVQPVITGLGGQILRGKHCLTLPSSKLLQPIVELYFGTYSVAKVLLPLIFPNVRNLVTDRDIQQKSIE